MLRLFGVPTWKMSNQADALLPASLPACLLIYLACEGRWLEREAVASVFWPERSPEEARHNLRVNLQESNIAANEFSETMSNPKKHSGSSLVFIGHSFKCENLLQMAGIFFQSTVSLPSLKQREAIPSIEKLHQQGGIQVIS